MDMIEIIPLQNDYTQTPNALINSDVGNNTFRAIVWLLSLRGGTVSSRQISDGARVVYNGRPHRAIMAELRALGLLTSQKAFGNNGKIIGEYLTIDLTKTPKSPVRAKRPNRENQIETPEKPGSAKRPTRSAKRPTSQCETTLHLKTNCAETAPATNGALVSARKVEGKKDRTPKTDPKAKTAHQRKIAAFIKDDEIVNALRSLRHANPTDTYQIKRWLESKGMGEYDIKHCHKAMSPNYKKPAGRTSKRDPEEMSGNTFKRILS